MSFEQKSYQAHEGYFEKIMNNIEPIKKDFEIFFRTGTVHRWKYERILNNIDFLFKIFPGAKWLTIGDGRFGGDANYIQSNIDNKSQVIASDISDYLLKYSQERNRIKEIMKINAEKIQLKDNSVDFTLCKESFHHFPRPNLALYEMLRVSKKAVVLIEPTDYNTNQSIFKRITLKLLKPLFKKINIKILEDSYEKVGNYIYRLSKNELKKMATALNLSYIAFKGINDYNWKSQKANFSQDADDSSKTYTKTKGMIKFLDFLSKYRILSQNLTIAILFKEDPNPLDLITLSLKDFEIIKLSKNPYLK